MNTPNFNNTPNFKITSKDGETYWQSRSMAVVGIPVFRLPNLSLWIPAGIRSDKMCDYQGKLGLVCGYLDWDESAWDAMRREMWEEIGLDLSVYFDRSSEPQPSSIQSDPKKDDRQNVTLRYRNLIDVEQLPELKSSAEVSAAVWIEEGSESNEYAFNHGELVTDAFRCAQNLSHGRKIEFKLNRPICF